MFLTETAREFGTVFLPACSSFEKDGTFMNAERRIQRVRAALPPAGAAQTRLADRLRRRAAMGGRGFAFSDPEEIWDEVRAVCDGARGMIVRQARRGGLQWPCPAEDHPGTPILHAGTSPPSLARRSNRSSTANTRRGHPGLPVHADHRDGRSISSTPAR